MVVDQIDHEAGAERCQAAAEGPRRVRGRTQECRRCVEGLHFGEVLRKCHRRLRVHHLEGQVNVKRHVDQVKAGGAGPGVHIH